jgi:ATP-dependent DNA ligase
VRLFTKEGHHWTDRYPWIVASALKNRQKHFVIDGEALVLGVDGISDFGALMSRKQEVAATGAILDPAGRSRRHDRT